MGRCHKVDVVGALFFKFQENFGKAGNGDLFSEVFMA